MNDLHAARAQMGTSLAFHIIFAGIGVGLPLLLLIAEGLWLRTKNPVYLKLAKKWANATAILFAVGAVSGTVLSFEMGLLWPGFMKFAGGIIGMPFSMEGFAFFIEAIFLGLYLYGWKRLSPLAHWLTTIPLAISGAISGIFVIAVNGWMNSPAGFRMENGKPVDIEPLKAMFNPAWGPEALHGTLASYVSVGFAVASVYAVGLLRGRRTEYNRKGMALGLLIGCVMIPLQMLSGDISARYVAENQPAKLAAMEAQYETRSCAPLHIGGIPDPQTHTVQWAFEIPCGLSFLATHDPNATIRGLDSFPAGETPNPLIVHTAFLLMVGCGIALFGLALWVGFLVWRKRTLADGRWLLWAVALCGPLGFMAIEFGWTVTEVGRQPWIVYGLFKTSDAVTPTPGLLPTFIGFTLLYFVLSGMVIWLLRRLAKIKPEEGDHDGDGHSETLQEQKEESYARA